MTALLWVRRDLRVHDNPALCAALDAHSQVVPVFCLDPRLLDGRNRSASRTAFMLSCLVLLDEALRGLGSGLVLRHGRPERLIPELAASVGAEQVFAASDAGPFACARDQAVADALVANGAELVTTPGTFVIDDLRSIRTGTGHPYTVFTPFYRRWLATPRRAVLPVPTSLPALPVEVELGALPKQDVQHRHASLWPGGEPAARERLAALLDETVERYAERHDTLGDPGTSELSPYLHFGCVSPRELEYRLPEGDGAVALRRQLCWRDFYAHVLRYHPANVVAEHQQRYRRRIRWTRSEPLFEAWRDGRTGYPLVDAGMRELAATGWMHNRARMVVGSFLVKDLGIDWRWGERWFMRALIDGDLANNSGNWQWIASVGVDPQPPARRIYNPTLQQRRFDPEGRYVRRHVPELAGVPDAYLAEPWTMPLDLQREVGCVIGIDYPEPIVDHTMARREALARYAAARGEAG